MKSFAMSLISVTIFLSGSLYSQTDSTVMLPRIVKTVAPEYPAEARRNNITGVIWLKILVDTLGIPKQVIITKSANDIFNEPSIAAAKQYVFAPATKNGKAIESWISLPFQFSLNQPGRGKR